MQAEYVRAKGFDLEQMEQLALDYLHEHGKISRHEIANLCKINDDQAYRLLKNLVKKHPQIQSKGSGKNTFYVWVSNSL
jgi:ATP-dependent DNA helicase RecG